VAIQGDFMVDSLALEQFFPWVSYIFPCFCGLVVKVPGYRYRGPDSIPGATRFSEK
jgi:hypothetical protein